MGERDALSAGGVASRSNGDGVASKDQSLQSMGTLTAFFKVLKFTHSLTPYPLYIEQETESAYQFGSLSKLPAAISAEG